MSAIDELLDERYWEPDRSFTPQVWTYIGEEDPREAAAELAALREENEKLSLDNAELTFRRKQVLELMDELAAANKAVDKASRLASALLDKMNLAYKNTEYKAAFYLYGDVMGDYKKNGGTQWTDEQDALAAWLTAHPTQKEQR
jgi:hypothetical protein